MPFHPGAAAASQPAPPLQPAASAVPHAKDIELVGCIFVPAEMLDLDSAEAPPATQLDRLRAKLAHHKAYAEQVGRAILATLEREHQRALQAARHDEAVGADYRRLPVRLPSTLAPDEDVDRMVRNMQAALTPGRPASSYAVTDADIMAEMAFPPFPVGQTPREWVSMHCLQLRYRAMEELAAHEERAGKVTKEIEAEIRRVMDASGP
ncbi:hypothetical protein B0I35DRAFT_510924 [Stachybotrys elegans]|uniref:Uncharacterized protein n=1 Tax=Stachybotrys elegans TaxID=80388 RepID=A0A8K0SSG4_9HYPO|nr:hypothetical protein B0I35DRAFT_510924 [Stachybotrys elegans]